MRVLVCGGRDFDDRVAVFCALNKLQPSVVIQGGARGADRLAVEWAYLRGARCETFNANWVKNGKFAGPIRNQQMLDEGRPDLVLAFPGGRGTADMVRRARKAGIAIHHQVPAGNAAQPNPKGSAQ